MWSNYLLTSFRILKQNAFFVSMNLLSIAIAFALCTIGYFNYQFNADFNTHFTKSDNIVKVNSQRSSDSGGRTMGVTPLPLASTINQGLSGLRSARYTSSQQFIRLNEDLYRQNVAFVDEDFLEIFNFKLANGQRARFSNKAEVFLTQQTKKAIFGEEDATGKTIEIALDNNETVLVKVAGVLDFIPENTSFIFDLILPFDYYLQINSLDRNDWTAWVDGTFIEKDIKRSNNEISSLLAKYLNYQNEVNQDQQVESYKVSSILDWPAFESSLYKSGFRGYLHPASVAGTISSAVAVLLLALFNFINTSLSLSRKRLKEIGVRKVMGGARLDLKIQFLIESFGQILLALMLSVAITHYLSIGYNSMFPFDIVSFERVSVLPLLIFMLSVWFFTGLLSGIYPAFYISKFQSVDIFRSKVKFSRRNLFSKTLITIQFAVCIYNVFALIVFAQNTQYQNTLDRGYNVNNSINVPISDKGQYKALQASLEQQLEIEQVTGTVNPIGFGDSETVVEYLTNKIDVSGIRVGTSYLESLDVKLYNGRFFKDLDGDNYVIVNQMLNNQLGGKLLNDWIYHEGKRYQVVGIVKDFNLRPIMLDNKIRPTIIFHAAEDQYRYVNIRTGHANINWVNKRVERKWKELYPDQMYLSFMQSDVLRALNRTNKIMLSINSFVALIILLITSIGLYAQVSMNAQSRIKEFGVRKVLGAPIRNIIYLINKEIVIMMIIASIIGLLGGNMAINLVLDIVYAYHREIDLPNFIWPIIVVFTIMVFSIARVVWDAAKANPVDQLRPE